jgi:hypothetical protein
VKYPSCSQCWGSGSWVLPIPDPVAKNTNKREGWKFTCHSLLYGCLMIEGSGSRAGSGSIALIRIGEAQKHVDPLDPDPMDPVQRHPVFRYYFPGCVISFIIWILETDSDSRSEDSDVVEEEGNRGRYRYQRRKGRKVIDLESCLDHKNYVLME